MGGDCGWPFDWSRPRSGTEKAHRVSSQALPQRYPPYGSNPTPGGAGVHSVILHYQITEVAFSDRLNIGFNLLGRKDIFEGFDEVIFRETQREVEL